MLQIVTYSCKSSLIPRSLNANGWEDAQLLRNVKIVSLDLDAIQVSKEHLYWSVVRGHATTEPFPYTGRSDDGRRTTLAARMGLTLADFVE